MTHFASPGVPLDAMVAVDQKASPAYPRFYNGGGSLRSRPREPGGRKSASGVQEQSSGRDPGGRSPQKLKQNVKLLYNC